MSIKSRNDGWIRYYDSVTGEIVLPIVPVIDVDDFVGKSLDTTNGWNARSTNGGSQGLKANDHRVQLALASTNEIELKGYDQNDQRPYILSKGLLLEAIVQLPVLPTLAAIAFVGFGDAHNAALGAMKRIGFRWDGAGLITVEHNDGTHSSAKVTTGVTLGTGALAYLLCDLRTPTDCRFYVNGARVAPSTTFNMNATPALALQKVMRIGKEAASAAVGTLEVDKFGVYATSR